MSIVVEDGTGLANANSYVSVADADAYHSARGNSAWTESSTSPDQGKTAALIRATTFIDGHYRGRWPGTPLNGRDQALAWPRENATDAEGNDVASDEVPREIIATTCEAALRELQSPGSLQPDLERGGAIRRLKAGSVEVEYADNALNTTTLTLIDDILSGLITTGSGGGLFAEGVRG